MSAEQKKAAAIIHNHAVLASGAAGVLSQTTVLSVGSSAVLIASMFNSLIKTFRPDIVDAEDLATKMGGFFLGWASGTLVVRSAVGLIPVFGNLASAALTFGMFETIGWGIFALLQDGRDIATLTKSEFKKFMKIGKKVKLDVTGAIEKMPPHGRIEYDRLVDELKKKSLSEAERHAVQEQIAALLDPYLAG